MLELTSWLSRCLRTWGRPLLTLTGTLKEVTVHNDWSGQTFPHPGGRKPFLGDVAGTNRTRPLQSTMARCAGLGPIFELNVFAQKFVFIAGSELAAELCDETRFHKALSPALVALREFA